MFRKLISHWIFKEWTDEELRYFFFKTFDYKELLAYFIVNDFKINNNINLSTAQVFKRKVGHEKNYGGYNCL